MTPTIDVNDFAGDVIVLDEKDNRINNVARAPRSLQQCSLDGQVFLIFAVILRKQNRPRRNSIYLDRWRQGPGQSPVDRNQRRLGNAVVQISGPNDFARDIDEVYDLPV